MAELHRESPQPRAGGRERFASLNLKAQVIASGRSWWEVLYVGGRTLAEWQTGGVGRALEFPLDFIQPRSKWGEIDHKNIVAARLWCPNGMIAEVEAPKSANGEPRPNCIIQFKVGVAFQGYGHVLQCHVLGSLTEKLDGSCELWEWTPELVVSGKLLKPGQLTRYSENVFTMHQRYAVGPFSLEALDIKT